MEATPSEKANLVQLTEELGKWETLLNSPQWTFFESFLKADLQKNEAIHFKMKETNGMWESMGYCNALRDILRFPQQRVKNLTEAITQEKERQKEAHNGRRKARGEERPDSSA